MRCGEVGERVAEIEEQVARGSREPRVVVEVIDGPRKILILQRVLELMAQNEELAYAISSRLRPRANEHSLRQSIVEADRAKPNAPRNARSRRATSSPRFASGRLKKLRLKASSPRNSIGTSLWA